MQALEHNIELFRGNTFSKKISLTDKKTSTPIDISGWTFYFTIKKVRDMKNLTDDKAILKKTINVENGADGIVIFPLIPSETSLISPTNYKYDITYKKTNGVVTTLIYGNFTVLPSVTRST